jgi:hypothetical protein
MTLTEQPPNCPNQRCTQHRRRPGPPPVHDDGGPFFRRKGSFARTGDRRVARFQCKRCLKHFSEQTFSDDYREKRPELMVEVRRLILAGYSQRRSARLLGVNRKTISRRARRLHVPRSPGLEG